MSLVWRHWLCQRMTDVFWSASTSASASARCEIEFWCCWLDLTSWLPRRHRLLYCTQLLVLYDPHNNCRLFLTIPLIPFSFSYPLQAYLFFSFPLLAVLFFCIQELFEITNVVWVQSDVSMYGTGKLRFADLWHRAVWYGYLSLFVKDRLSVFSVQVNMEAAGPSETLPIITQYHNLTAGMSPQYVVGHSSECHNLSTASPSQTLLIVTQNATVSVLRAPPKRC